MTVDDPFRIRAHVRDFDAIAEDYQRASDGARRRWRTARDIAYGDTGDERLDLYFPDGGGANRPVHLFIHGGYWRADCKENYGFIANTICSAGAIAAILDYALMPRARMATLIGQVRRAASWLAAHAQGFGGDPDMLSASGHSAGAHLASYLTAWGLRESRGVHLAPVRSLLLISGLYDLEPISRSFLQSEIHLTPDEIEAWSPLQSIPQPATSIAIAVGTRETLPFHTQAVAFWHHLAANGPSASVRTVRGVDHMSIVRDLGSPGTEMADLLASLIRLSIQL